MKLELTRNAAKSLDKIPDKYAHLIIEHLQQLAKNPYPLGSRKLTGQDTYRLRVGVYRIIYWRKNKDTLVVLRLKHRKDIYRP